MITTIAEEGCSNHGLWPVTAVLKLLLTLMKKYQVKYFIRNSNINEKTIFKENLVKFKMYIIHYCPPRGVLSN